MKPDTKKIDAAAAKPQVKPKPTPKKMPPGKAMSTSKSSKVPSTPGSQLGHDPEPKQNPKSLGHVPEPKEAPRKSLVKTLGPKPRTKSSSSSYGPPPDLVRQAEDALVQARLKWYDAKPSGDKNHPKRSRN